MSNCSRFSFLSFHTLSVNVLNYNSFDWMFSAKLSLVDEMFELSLIVA